MNLKLRLVASACLGVLMAIAMVFGIACAYAAIVKPVVTSQIIAYMGPTHDPTGRGFYEKALPMLAEYNAGRELEFIEYPADLWPATGPDSLSLDASVAIGVQNALQSIAERDRPGMFLLGGSQSSTVLSQVKQYYVAHPETAPPAEDLTFLLIANPSRPNGGMLARLPGLYIEPLDLTFSGPTPNDQYVTYDVAWAYDGFANFPKYPINILADLNAYMGIKALHGAVPDIFDPNNDVSVSVAGNTTYYTLMAKHLPIFGPMRDAGWGPLVDVIEPLTKVWIDMAYDHNDPRANPGVAQSARLFIPLRNIVVALLRTPGAIIEGLKTIPAGIRTLRTGNPVTNVQNIVNATVNEVVSSIPDVLPTVEKATGLRPSVNRRTSVSIPDRKSVSSQARRPSAGSLRPASAQKNVRPSGKPQSATGRAGRPHASATGARQH